jgi:DNA-directed RNA polymerase specialized sigma24 family protein
VDGRGSQSAPVSVDQSIAPVATRMDAVDALDLDRASQKLEQLDPDAAKLIEVRFFGGLTVEETAAVLGVSIATVKRDWA